MNRLPTHLIVSALVRSVSNAGGNAAVLARGDRDSGTILVLALERGENARFFERGFDDRGRDSLVSCGPLSASTAEETADYWQRRRRFDPDLWVIEVDIPFAERFAAETIVGG